MTNRRDFLLSCAGVVAASTTSAFPVSAFAAPARPDGWRKFRMETSLSLSTAERAHVWLPLPATVDPDWIGGLDTVWTSNADAVREVDGGPGKASYVEMSWNGGKAPTAKVVSTFSLKDRTVDVNAHSSTQTLTAAERACYTSGSRLAPINGIVRKTALSIVDPSWPEIEKVRAIYQWVVEHTYRKAETRGCGEGDILAMLQSGQLGGKCADLNGLFVSLVRSMGVPARELYGIRVGASRRGYQSLGANAETISKSQHCRAEVFLDGCGWTPMDPADVRKVMLEELPRNLPLDEPKVIAAREQLFGSWEGNWLPYNDARDVDLAGDERRVINFLMYPQAEVAGALVDCLDPDTFRYQIKSNEIQA
jgi:transglutaminase-like putative cysteine protease